MKQDAIYLGNQRPHSSYQARIQSSQILKRKIQQKSIQHTQGKNRSLQNSRSKKQLKRVVDKSFYNEKYFLRSFINMCFNNKNQKKSQDKFRYRQSSKKEKSASPDRPSEIINAKIKDRKSINISESINFKPLMINCQNPNSTHKKQIINKNPFHLIQKQKTLYFNKSKTERKISSSRALELYSKVFKNQNYSKIQPKKRNQKNNQENSSNFVAKRIILRQKKQAQKNIENNNSKHICNCGKLQKLIKYKQVNHIIKSQQVVIDQNFQLKGWEVKQ